MPAKIAVVKITLTEAEGTNLKDWEIDAISEALDEVGWSDIVKQKIEEAGIKPEEVKIEVSDL